MSDTKDPCGFLSWPTLLGNSTKDILLFLLFKQILFSCSDHVPVPGDGSWLLWPITKIPGHSGSDWYRHWSMRWKRMSAEKASGNDFPPIKRKSSEKNAPLPFPSWLECCLENKWCFFFLLEEGKKGQDRHKDSKPLPDTPNPLNQPWN